MPSPNLYIVFILVHIFSTLKGHKKTSFPDAIGRLFRGEIFHGYHKNKLIAYGIRNYKMSIQLYTEYMFLSHL